MTPAFSPARLVTSTVAALHSNEDRQQDKIAAGAQPGAGGKADGEQVRRAGQR